MPGRIFLFGVTGFTGRLTAAALSRALTRRETDGGPVLVLAGRNRNRLDRLAEELAASGGARPDIAVADAGRPEKLAALLDSEDVLVTTVGPFERYGGPAVEAAIQAGAIYLDSTGEPAFLRRVFLEYGPRAALTGAQLLPAFGYDFVPGNLAAALALRAAGPDATRVDVGYFVTGGVNASGGTRASAVDVFLRPGPAWRGGRLGSERLAARVRTFDVGGHSLAAVSIGASEHLALPRSFPGLTDVDVYLGWTARLSRAAQLGSAVAQLAVRAPGVTTGADALVRRISGTSSGGPSPRTRTRSRSVAVAEARAPDRTPLARVVLDGPGPYDLTAELLSWAAVTARRGGVRGVGALGPVDGFGLDELAAGCAGLGLKPTEGASTPS